MTDPASLQSLIAALKNFKTRATAHRQLLALGGVAIPALTELLQDAEAPENARWVAIDILGELKAVAAQTALLAVANANLRLRSAACQALQRTTGQEWGEDMAAWEQALAGPGGGTATPPVENADFAFIREALGNTVQELSWEEPGYAYMRLPLDSGRSQQLVISFETDPKTAARQLGIYTECGLSETIPRHLIDRRNVTLRCGQFHAEKDEASGKYRITLRHVLPLAKLSPAELREIIASLGYEADSLEFELTGADRI